MLVSNYQTPSCLYWDFSSWKQATSCSSWIGQTLSSQLFIKVPMLQKSLNLLACSDHRLRSLRTLASRKKWKKKVTNSWPVASASCKIPCITGSQDRTPGLWKMINCYSPVQVGLVYTSFCPWSVKKIISHINPQHGTLLGELPRCSAIFTRLLWTFFFGFGWSCTHSRTSEAFVFNVRRKWRVCYSWWICWFSVDVLDCLYAMLWRRVVLLVDAFNPDCLNGKKGLKAKNLQ